jgi:predicted ATPase
MISDRLDAVAQALGHTHAALRQLAGTNAVIAALQGDWRRFAEALQKHGTLDLQ